ncbi:MAG: dTMP kinase [bacterium]|nr:dTMP kinase [bacterium]
MAGARRKGVFISIEGLDGSGKDTQIEILERRSELQGAIFTREPGGTDTGVEIRSIILSQRITPLTTEAELLLFLAARAELVGKVIRPALEAGKIVVSNRFGLSTTAYQIYGRQRPDLLPLLQELSAQIVGADVPHYVLLDVPAAVVEERTKNRGALTPFDVSPLEFHERVRRGFLAHVHDHAKSVVIDGTQSPEKVAEEVWKAVSSWL